MSRWRTCAREFHAILLAGGAEQPRDLPVPGRELKGIHFAMEFLPQQNRRNEGDTVPEDQAILATGKRVTIIGGGDTGADCLGTSHRQGALSVTQFELLPKPPDERSPETPWPLWPLQLRVETSHEEGGVRDWSVMTERFTGDDRGRVTQLHAVRVGPAPKFERIAGIGIHAGRRPGAAGDGLHGTGEERLDRAVRRDAGRPRERCCRRESHDVGGWRVRGGRLRRGQSLVVWAIAEGRRAAAGIDGYLRRGK